MTTKPYELPSLMKEMIAREIERLATTADALVFARYDPDESDAGPKDFRAYDREEASPLLADIRFDFEGIGVWSICNRSGDRFHMRQVLVWLRDGRFVYTHFDTSDGAWADFAHAVADDSMVKAAIDSDPESHEAAA